MTPKEISEFVNQPIPRRVPYEIFCAVTRYSSRRDFFPLSALAFFIVMLMFLSAQQIFLCPVIVQRVSNLKLSL